MNRIVQLVTQRLIDSVYTMQRLDHYPFTEQMKNWISYSNFWLHHKIGSERKTFESQVPGWGLWGGWEGVRWHFFGALQNEMYLLPSLLLVGDFCRNRVFSLNIRPSVTYRQRPFCKLPNVRFFLVYQSLCLTFCVGVACLGKIHAFSSLGGACYAHKTNGDFLG